MTRALALVVALLFAVGVALPSAAWAQATKAPAAKSDKADAKATGEKRHAPLDINTAPAADLETLPGIGEAYSKKIIENRPYKRKDELVQGIASYLIMTGWCREIASCLALAAG